MQNTSRSVTPRLLSFLLLIMSSDGEVLSEDDRAVPAIFWINYTAIERSLFVTDIEASDEIVYAVDLEQQSSSEFTGANQQLSIAENEH